MGNSSRRPAKFFRRPFYFVIFVLSVVHLSPAFAQVPKGMVTEELATPDEYGQRAFLTYRADDPYAADIARDSSWWVTNRSVYRYTYQDASFLRDIHQAFIRSLSRKQMAALCDLNQSAQNQMGFVFTVDDEGRLLSVVFKYPDIPEYTSISPRNWRRLERKFRKYISFEYSNAITDPSRVRCRIVRKMSLRDIIDY